MNVQKDRDRPDDSGELRRRTEAALRGREFDADTLSVQQARHLIHKLTVHQIELVEDILGRPDPIPLHLLEHRELRPPERGLTAIRKTHAIRVRTVRR